MRNTLLASAKELGKFPDKYQVDEYYGDQKVRRYFVWDYRIVFEIFDSEVIVLSIYRTSQSPYTFKK